MFLISEEIIFIGLKKFISYNLKKVAPQPVAVTNRMLYTRCYFLVAATFIIHKLNNTNMLSKNENKMVRNNENFNKRMTFTFTSW